ncbi:MAG: hypothetical protein U9R19_01305 [Bacteroidota bacterium]|nr:hypothetical protein [Bacteroidota bacterium]
MKKVFLVISILSLAFAIQLNAQYADTKLINVGVSISQYGKYYHDFEMSKLEGNISIPIFLQYETGLGDKIDNDDFRQHVTMGVFLGYQKQNFKPTIAISYEVYKNYSYLWGGVVGTLHGVDLANKYLDFSIPADKWDIYLSVKGGLVLEFYQSNYNSNPADMDVQLGKIDINELRTLIYLAPVLGARYYLLENVSVFTEIGRANMSNFSLGVSAKF